VCPPQTSVHRDVRHIWCAAGAAKSELTSTNVKPYVCMYFNYNVAAHNDDDERQR